MRVAEISEMIGLGAVVDPRRLHLDEIANVHLVSKRRAGSQARVRADARLGADSRSFEVRERLDSRVAPHRHVAQHAMGANHDAVVEAHVALEDAADVDRHIAAAT